VAGVELAPYFFAVDLRQFSIERDSPIVGPWGDDLALNLSFPVRTAAIV
jgi:hypothetical protein